MTTTFYIYTTGISDITKCSDGYNWYGLLDIWINTTCNNICNIIPLTFNNIIIQHYDPIIYAEQYNLSISNTISTINNHFINSTNYLDSRISNQIFYCRCFDIRELSYPHLIIDMAHIFKYSIGKTVRWSNHYESIYKNPYIELESIPIKAIYIQWNNSDFVQKKLIEISNDGYVRTYIDCMEDSGFITECIYDPVETLFNIVLMIRIQFMSKWREVKKAVKSTDLGGKFDETIDDLQLIDQLLDKLFLNKTKDEILDITTYKYYDKFYLKLCDQSCY